MIMSSRQIEEITLATQDMHQSTIIQDGGGGGGWGCGVEGGGREK